MSEKVKELFITKSFLPLLSSSQEIQSLKNSALWIWNLLNNNKEKVSNKQRQEPSPNDHVQDDRFNSSHLATENTFFFLSVEDMS